MLLNVQYKEQQRMTSSSSSRTANAGRDAAECTAEGRAAYDGQQQQAQQQRQKQMLLDPQQKEQQCMTSSSRSSKGKIDPAGSTAEKTGAA